MYVCMHTLMMTRLTSLTNARVESAVSMAAAPPIPPLPIFSPRSRVAGSPRGCLPACAAGAGAEGRRRTTTEEARCAGCPGVRTLLEGGARLYKERPRRVAPSASLTGHTCGEIGRAPWIVCGAQGPWRPATARGARPAEGIEASSHHV